MIQGVWGIDVGVSGALVYFEPNPENTIAEIYDMPVLQVGNKNKYTVSGTMVADILKQHDAPVWIEMVSAMPNQGVTSMFNFGRSFGVIIGCVDTLNYPSNFVTPRTWQKAMNVQGKDGSRQEAMKRLPKHFSQFTRKKDNGRSDAALIAMYGFIYGESVENRVRQQTT